MHINKYGFPFILPAFTFNIPINYFVSFRVQLYISSNLLIFKRAFYQVKQNTKGNE